MGKAHFLGDAAGVMDVDPGTAGAFLGQRRAVVVELQRYAHHIIALFGELGRDDGTVDAAGHGHDDAGFRGRLGQAERVERVIEGHNLLRWNQRNIGKS